MAPMWPVKVTRGWSAAKFHDSIVLAADCGTKQLFENGIEPAPVGLWPRKIYRDLTFARAGLDWAWRLSRIDAGMMDVVS